MQNVLSDSSARFQLRSETVNIIHTRIDDRLIHGQVVVIWSKLIRYDVLLVVDDVSATNQMMKSVLMMAAPSGYRTVIATLDEAVRMLNDDAYAASNVFLIVKSFDVARKLIDGGFSISSINLGNLGGKPGARQLNRSTYLTQSDIDAVKELSSRGIRLTNQMVPNDRETNLLEDVKKLG